MAVSLTLMIKRVSQLPLPAKFPPSSPPPFLLHSPLSNPYSSSPLIFNSGDHTLHFTSGSDSLLASLIDTSTHKTHLHQIHAHLLVLGFPPSAFLTTKLVNAASNLGHISYARHLFDEFPDPTVFLYNAIIRGYSKHNEFFEAVEMYCLMQERGVRPDGFTFPHVFKACGGVKGLELGCRVHGQVFRRGFQSDAFVQNSLVAFYAKCGRVERARIVFDGLGERSAVSWSSIISGYAQNGDALEALRMFGLMRKTDVKPDWVVLVSVLKGYSDVEDLGQGRGVHGCLVKLGLEFEPDLVVSLMALYAKCGQVVVARLLFDGMGRPNVMMWNAMISGYVKNGHAEKAVELFREMIGKGVRIDSITLRSAIVACAQVGSLELAKWMDDYISRSEYGNHVFVNTALIDMYAKCGSVEFARVVFDRTPDKDVVVWSAMIVGYGLHGRGREAIDVYHSMQQAGVVPNDVTFLGLLTACNHSGLVHEGWELFHRMRVYGIEPGTHHYSCVVDLLGRAGQLEQAYDFIKKMPVEPGTSVWGALLSSCSIHRNVTLGELAAEKLFSVDPYEIGHYVQLSNLFASARIWDRVAQVRVLMREKELVKGIGHSLIEINGKLQAFHVGDKSHPRSEEIYVELESLENRLKEAGFVPHTESYCMI